MSRDLTVPLPASFQRVVDHVAAAPTKIDALHRAYDAITAKYHGDRWSTLTRWPELYAGRIEKLWARTGFLHCTNFNRLMIVTLVRSGKFTRKDIRKIWTILLGYSPHQYIAVRVDNGQWITVDAWARRYYVPFGYACHGFRAYRHQTRKV